MQIPLKGNHMQHIYTAFSGFYMNSYISTILKELNHLLPYHKQESMIIL